jgi:hypothetical protein
VEQHAALAAERRQLRDGIDAAHLAIRHHHAGQNRVWGDAVGQVRRVDSTASIHL